MTCQDVVVIVLWDMETEILRVWDIDAIIKMEDV